MSIFDGKVYSKQAAEFMYICDPDKNEKCTKEYCHLTDGPKYCYLSFCADFLPDSKLRLTWLYFRYTLEEIMDSFKQSLRRCYLNVKYWLRSKRDWVSRLFGTSVVLLGVGVVIVSGSIISTTPVGDDRSITPISDPAIFDCVGYTEADFAPQIQVAVTQPEEFIQPEDKPAYQEYIAYITQTYGIATGDAAAFQRAGVLDFNSWRVTYYNPTTLGTSHNALGQYTIGQGISNRGDGIGVTPDGYIAVAMPADVPYGTIVDTPFGPGMCVDHSGGAMDVVVYF